MSPGFFRRVLGRQGYQQTATSMIHKGTDRAIADFRAGEGEQIVPTISEEIAEIEEDREGAVSAAQSAAQLAPGSVVAADAEAAAERAAQDEKIAEAALEDARRRATSGRQAASSITGNAFTDLGHQMGDTMAGRTGAMASDAAAADQALAETTAHLGSIEEDLATASHALADADAAKARAESDAESAAANVPPPSPGRAPG